jgi:hypothetical protein
MRKVRRLPPSSQEKNVLYEALNEKQRKTADAALTTMGCIM